MLLRILHYRRFAPPRRMLRFCEDAKAWRKRKRREEKRREEERTVGIAGAFGLGGAIAIGVGNANGISIANGIAAAIEVAFEIGLFTPVACPAHGHTLRHKKA